MDLSKTCHLALISSFSFEPETLLMVSERFTADSDCGGGSELVRPPCETMVVKLLPALRALISRHLIKDYSFTQDQTAQALGVTQASVSRGLSQLDRFEQYFTPNVRQFAENFARQISQRELGVEEGIASLCSFCSSQKIGGTLCQLHRAENLELKNCLVCAKGFTSDDRSAVLANLTRSLELLVETPEFVPLIPQVRSQLVMSIPNPRDINDVAGFPSRIVTHHMRPHSFTSPEFRGSYHLSKVLLLMQRHIPKLRAAIVFKYFDGLDTVLKQLDYKYFEVVREPVENLTDIDEALFAGVNKVLKQVEFIEVLIDKGQVGIEPVAYLFAPDAETATNMVIRIAKILED